MIKFSVITCTYNASAVLARTLDSVLSQSWTQIEHIIIDGASKDNTLAMAQAYSLKNQEEENEHEVVIVSEPDRGLYDAMNKGLARAQATILSISMPATCSLQTRHSSRYPSR